MMADIADEAMLLTSLLDSEDVDPAILNKDVHNFDTTMSVLFGDTKKMPRCLWLYFHHGETLAGAIGCLASGKYDLQHRLRQTRGASRYD